MACDGLFQRKRVILLVVAAVVVQACSGDDEDDDVTSLTAVPNQAPSVAILGPEPDSTFEEGEEVMMSGTVSDDHDAPRDLEVLWISSLDGVLDDDGANSQGQTEFRTSSLSVGEHTLMLEASDSEGASSDHSITITVNAAPNTPPNATITSPANNASFLSGTEITLSGTIEDAEDAPSGLSGQFFSSLSGSLDGSVTPDSRGQVSIKLPLADGEHEITLEAADSEGAKGVSSPLHITVLANEPPEVTLEPLEQTLVNEGESVAITGYVDDDSTALSRLDLAWSSSLDGPLSCGSTPDTSGTIRCTFSGLSAGGHDITLEATDDAGGVGSDTVELTVNGRPSAPVVRIDPSEPRTNDTLNVVLDAPSVDPEGDDVSLSYHWYLSEAPINGLTSDSVDSTLTSLGDVWRVEVIPSDPYVEGPAGIAEVVIGNTPPELGAVDISPPSGNSSTEFTCQPSGKKDVDGDLVDVAYSWLRQGVEVDDATDNVFVPEGFRHGETLRCVATPDDGTDQGESVRSQEAIIEGREPSITGVTITPEGGGKLTEFTCEPSGWADPDDEEEGYLFQWYVNGAKGPSEEKIDGDSFSKTDTIYCEVTPFDGSLTGAPLSSDSITISNTPPTVTALLIKPDPAFADSNVTCETVDYEDPDDDAEQSVFQWYLNGASIEAARSVSLDHVLTRGDVIGCTAYVSDGESEPLELTADEVDVVNSPPTITSVKITPSAGGVDTEFTASATDYEDVDGDYEDVDGDDPEDKYHYQWYVNEAPSVTTPSIRGNLALGDTIRAEITPFDGFEEGATQESGSITIGAQSNPPSVDAVELTPDPAYTEDELTCREVGAYDPEGDAIDFAYEWFKNGEPILGLDDSEETLGIEYFVKRDEIVCAITPYDPSDSSMVGSSMRSNRVTILNSAPTASGVDIEVEPEGSPPVKSSKLYCEARDLKDADGDEIFPAYIWYRNDEPVAGVTSNLLTSANFWAGDVIYCTVTPNDGAASSETLTSGTVTIEDTPPVITGVTLTPAVADETTELVCTPQGMHDDDDDPIEIIYAWFNGTSVIKGQSGATLTGVAFDKGDEISCRVTPLAAGNYGETETSNTVVIRNFKPVVGEVVLGPDPADVTMELICEARGVVDEDGGTPELEYSWTVNDAAITATSDTLSGDLLRKGDSVYCSITPHDDEGPGLTADSNELIIVNRPPRISSVRIEASPDPATTESTLTCVPEGKYDADDDEILFRYAWFKNDVQLSDATTSSLSNGNFERDDVIVCEATPTDGDDSGEAARSERLTISNSPPAVGMVTLGPPLPYEADTLTCVPSEVEDADDDLVEVRYTWLVNGNTVPGESTDELTGEDFDRDDEVQCLATPNDSIEDGETVPSAVLTIANSPPRVAEAVLTPLEAHENTEFLCTGEGASDDDPGDELSLHYAWFVSNIEIPDATSETLIGDYFDKGDSVYCALTPDDGTSRGPVESSNKVMVLNSMPTVQGVTLSPEPATKANTLQCEYDTTSDDDDDTVAVAYAWTSNNAQIEGATEETLPSTAFVKGDEIYCTITPSDEDGPGIPSSSNKVLIENSPPTIGDVFLDPDPAYEDSDLTCIVTGEGDLDDDLVDLYFSWTVSGEEVVGAISNNLIGDYFDRGDDVLCTATPNDRVENGASVASDPIRISNTAPSIELVVLTPSSPTKADTLECEAQGVGEIDPGDTVSVTYLWTVSDEPKKEETVAAGSVSTLANTNFVKHDTVLCTATPYDGTDTGTSKDSATVEVRNTPPTVSDVTLGPEPANRTQTLTCGYGSYHDIDSDAVDFTYSWTVNGSTVPQATDSFLVLDPFARDSEVLCTITPEDDEAAGTPQSSNVVTIVNAPPSLESASLDPDPAYESSLIECKVFGSDDPDDDQVDVSFTWTVAGQAVLGATTSTLNGDYFDKGDAVSCTATPSDGTLDGSSVTSEAVVISNSLPSIDGVTLSPSAPTRADTLLCAADGPTDIDPADVVSASFVWKVGSSVVLTETLAAEASSQLTSSYFVRDDVVTCTITPGDGVEDGVPRSSSATIENAPPSLVDATLGPTPATRADTLTCSPGVSQDLDSDDISFTYLFTVAGLTVANGTQDTLVLASYARGSEVQCFVTPSDSLANGAEVPSNVVMIENTPPTIDPVQIQPADAYTNTPLTCAVSGNRDLDGDPISVTFAWTVDGVTATGEVTETLGETWFSKGQEVVCFATPSDEFDDGPMQESNPVTILNSIPEIPSIQVEPSAAYRNDTLTCVVETSDADAEDTVTLTYTWSDAGGTIAGETEETLSGVFVKGDLISCSAIPDDLDDTGSEATSSAVEILNSPPSIDNAGVTVMPPDTVPIEDATLVCSHDDAADIDEETINIVFEWYVGLSSVPVTTDQLTGTYFNKGDEVYCVATPWDSEGAGTGARSAPVVIENTPPTLSSVNITSEPIYRDTVLDCTPVGYRDADGDLASDYSYAWYVGPGTPVEVPNYNGSQLSGQFKKGDYVYCEVTPNDGTENGALVPSSTVQVSNSPPAQPAVSISPLRPFAGVELIASASSSDIDDGDNVTFEYAWTKGGTTLFTTQTVPSGETSGGETWTVVVTPWDEFDYGSENFATVLVLSDVDGDGYAFEEDDCDDNDDTAYPGAVELAGADHDCNGAVGDRWEILHTYGWVDETWPYVGGDSALAIESDGLTHLYFGGLESNGTDGASLYASYNPASDSWPVQALDSNVSPAYQRLSLWTQTGFTSQLRTFVFDGDTANVVFRYFDGTTWSGPLNPGPTALPGNVASGLDLVTDDNGTDYLLFARTVGRGNCALGEIDTRLYLYGRTADSDSFFDIQSYMSSGCVTGSPSLWSPSMALGADGVLHVSWYVDTPARTGDVQYRRVIPTGTGSDNIDALSTNDVGRYNSMATVPGEDPSYPRIGYIDATDNLIMLATTQDFVNYTFTTELVADASALNGSVPSVGQIVLRYDANGFAHILFQAENGTELWYGTNETGTWVFEKIPTDSTVALSDQHYGMRLDVDGNPRFTLQDTVNEDLQLWKGKRHTTTLPF